MRHAGTFKMKGKGSLLRHKPRWQERGKGRDDQNASGSSVLLRVEQRVGQHREMALP